MLGEHELPLRVLLEAGSPADTCHRRPSRISVVEVSEDVGHVGGVLLDLGGFFSDQVPPEGQVGVLLRRPCSLIPFSRCSGRVKRHSRSAAEIDFHGPEGFVLIAAGVSTTLRYMF